MKLLVALAERSKKAFFQYEPFPRLDRASIVEVDVSEFSDEEWVACLNQERPDVLVTGWGTPRIPDEIAEDSNSSIRYICHLAGSVRDIVPRSMIERGVLVSNWGEAISYTIAEHAMLLVLAALRRVANWSDVMRVKVIDAKMQVSPQSLRHRRVCLHGFGAIARSLVPMLEGFQVTSITAYSEGVPSSVFATHGVAQADSLEMLFAQADVLIELEALRESTEQRVNEAVLSQMPEGAVFVNVGRGRVVDETALAKVAMERSLRVGLDVYSQEPLSKDSPLWKVPDIVLSPHIAGPTADAFQHCAQLALDNLKCFLNGESVRGIVTQEIYDRST